MDSYQKFIEEKARRKRELLGATFFPRTPVLCLDLSEIKNKSSVQDLLKGLESIHLTTLAIVSGKDAQTEGGKYVHPVDSEKKDKALAAADFVLVPSVEMLDSVRRHGCVPIAPLNGDSTANYDPLQQKGNGFYFNNPTKWEMFAAIVRATETYQFPYDWENLVREIL